MSDLLVAKNIVKRYPVQRTFWGKPKKFFAALDGVDISIWENEAHGLIGESGCGKTTLSKTLLALEKPTEGEVSFRNENIFRLSAQKLLSFRKSVQVVFQDPNSSLDPRMSIEEIIAEPFQIHSLYPNASERREKVAKLLQSVGLGKSFANRYPHEFSGGQLQRIAIARALALKPKLIIADEPVSALDVSVQAQILNLLKDLQKEFSLSYLFIAHDFSVIRFLCDRISVMYLGRIVETAPADEIFSNPQHPYTEALLSAVPIANPEIQKNRKPVLIPEVETFDESLLNQGCRFRNRCNYKTNDCLKVDPKLTDINPKHKCACNVLPFKKAPSDIANALTKKEK
jgi:oligopeptide/dipeptide ABC transporter ATP-binding protein